ncbi:MAG: peptidoglycan DD-metalloendopeptidase family protein [Gammaproteobacteria bacterium]
MPIHNRIPIYYEPPKPQRSYLMTLLLLIIAGVVASLLLFEFFSEEKSPEITQQVLKLPHPTQRPINAASLIEQHWVEIRVNSGDNLAKIFAQLNISPQTLYNIMQLNLAKKNLQWLRPGEQLRILVDQDRELKQLIYPIAFDKSLRIKSQNNQFSAEVIEHPIDTELKFASGKIESSLFIAGQKAGLSDKLIMNLTNIFGWDIDFAKDIQPGDKFSVVYEQHYLNGHKIKTGNIIAASFTNQGHTFEAVRYTDVDNHTGYYSPEGRSMQKAFLRTPVRFTRISSYFSTGRKHPILHRIRAHKGVDYAAPRGTPIKATGNGRIIFRGRKGGYGRAIIIKHGNKYSTLYGHMSRFKPGLQVGSSVKQGQIIGYVGMSGLATGPHLHYEFRIYGQHRNPLTIKLPQAQHIPQQLMTDFQQKTHQLLAQLNLFRSAQLASVDPLE